MHKLLLNNLRVTARKRPLGYYEDVVNSGRIEDGVLFVEDDLYIALRKKYSPKEASIRPTTLNGVGTELKKLLSKLGLKPVTGCKCNQHITEMNQKGVEWCQQNIDTIVGWLKEEADRAKLPFTNIGARIIVKRAIHNAKKK